jgi:CRP/FNR family transcriptional regulator
VFWEGDPKSHVFRVEEGVVAVYKVLPDGRRQVVDFACPGDYVEFDASRDHSFNAQAICAAKVRCYPARAFRNAAANDPVFAIELLNAASKKLAAARRLIVSIGQGAALERVASFLVTLCRKMGEHADGERVIHLPMRRSDIAGLLGLTIETVSRTLTKLRVMGLIEIVRGTEVHVRNFDRLEKLACA